MCFADASVPARAGPIPVASAERLEVLRAMATGGRLPRWTEWFDEADVAPMFPDARTRAEVAAEQSRLPLSYYEAALPNPPGWAGLPCGYLLFSAHYEPMALDAEERGWRVERLPGLHLHQLVDPDAVAERLLAMTSGWGAVPGG
ncbi:hypothetical protein [Actinoplanes sp. GCM10030250]|uniref:hypothetical protein n=1 Tax=Actinoplanes sp. GCM10030250 TaxID=3273376 RepID=UPI00361CDD4B